ncbi:phosphatidylinositol glycan anchor biosynthesis class U protein isoform X2 [Dermacentor andersoni]|uniref:phosphatidylinositol glycan anchor biosynthesis class U protein isoform X2 n=1 Tax=Dermacentor andersoni TaxID=34620 RepID=UPI002416641C|nr:phosphatidylinositol glycan anchor biosynthesis class U protein-like isoform X2 [Dermacentor andersoni]
MTSLVGQAGTGASERSPLRSRHERRYMDYFTEGLYLHRMQLSPYDGDIFHEPPLSLLVYDYVTKAIDEQWIPLLFIACDLVTALLLAVGAKKCVLYMVEQEAQAKKAKSSRNITLTMNSAGAVPKLVLAVYLLSPYSLLNCIGMATTLFSNLLVALFFASFLHGVEGDELSSPGAIAESGTVRLLRSSAVRMGNGTLHHNVTRRTSWWLIASVVLAVETYKSFYPVMLLLPALLYMHEVKRNSSHRSTSLVISAVVTFLVTLSCLLFGSYLVTSSWQFLWSTYGCICAVPDLTPNIGVFWYFFTEVFEHFRVFFLWIFQLNAFVYMVPLGIRLRKEPLLLFFLVVALTAVFKSYPSIGDVALYTSLLPIWRHVFPYMKQYFLVGCIFVSCSALAPLLWHLWIFSSSANANFYFGITLAFNTGQIFLITDLLFAHVKRKFYLENGDPKELEEKNMKLELR